MEAEVVVVEAGAGLEVAEVVEEVGEEGVHQSQCSGQFD